MEEEEEVRLYIEFKFQFNDRVNVGSATPYIVFGVSSFMFSNGAWSAYPTFGVTPVISCVSSEGDIDRVIGFIDTEYDFLTSNDIQWVSFGAGKFIDEHFGTENGAVDWTPMVVAVGILGVAGAVVYYLWRKKK